MLHIQIFPLTVADTFVTLSWNTSRSLARDFVLQVIMGAKNGKIIKSIIPFVDYDWPRIYNGQIGPQPL